MAKGRSNKLIVATLHGTRRALQDDLQRQWLVLSSFHWRMKLAALAERGIMSGDDSAFRTLAKKHDFNISIKAAAEESIGWRAIIFDMTATCVDRVLIEASAPKADDASKLLGTIAWAAGELAQAIEKARGGELGISISSEIESRLACREVEPLEKAPRYAREHPQVPMGAMLRHAVDYAQAAKSAKESLADDSIVVEGQAWDAWIAKLLKFSKNNDFPTTISSDSKFVQFVEVLQGAFSAELLRASALMRLTDKDRARLNDEITRHTALSQGDGEDKGNQNLSRSIARGIENANQRGATQAEQRRIADAERQAEEERVAAKESRRRAEELRRRKEMADLARLRHNLRLARRGKSTGSTGI